MIHHDNTFPEKCQTAESQSSSDTQTMSQKSAGSVYTPKGRDYEKKNVRGTINVMTDDVVAVLDRCKVSYRNSVLIICAIAVALNVNTDELILNKSSFHDQRTKIRQKNAEEIKTTFEKERINNGIAHWDGKIIRDKITNKKIDRLPVVISVGKSEKLLDVPGLDNGKGVTQALAIYNTLTHWSLTNVVKALCCDTTNSNLGKRKGAAVILEDLLNFDLLYLPCRHHIFEIILASAFEVKLPGSSGPNVPLFKKFAEKWADLNKNYFHSGYFDQILHPELQTQVGLIVSFIKTSLQEKWPRDDYREFLELALIFLEGNQSGKINFKKPEAFHHARWMSKAIYSLKIYIFRNSFALTSAQKKGLFDLCQFIVFIYVKAWFTSPLAVKAPSGDLEFFKKLWSYKDIDSEIADKGLYKFKNHLWYISPEASALSFFDKTLSIDTKRKMVAALKKEDVDLKPKKKFSFKKKENLSTILNKDIDYFINSHTLKFFDRFEIDKEFLNLEVSTWNENEKFQDALKLVEELQVVNDCAERSVHLFEEFSNILTTKEEQKQFLVQEVANHRKRCPDARKSTVTKKIKLNETENTN